MPMLFLHAPPLVIAEGRFQIRFLCIGADLFHKKGELLEITCADRFQIPYFPESPVLIFLLRQHSYVNQYIYRGGIP